MTDITISINEEELAKLALEHISEKMLDRYTCEAHDANHGVRKGIEQAVKDYVYSCKDELIEKCVSRASAELVKKSLPILLERMAKQETT